MVRILPHGHRGAAALAWAALAWAALVLGGCGTAGGGSASPPAPGPEAGPRIVQPGAPGEPTRALGAGEADFEAPGHTPADVAFAKGMIAHHAQALTMSALVAERTSNADIALLAERITISQRDEIRLMQDWLRARGETAPAVSLDTGTMGAGMDHELMPGMLTDEQMARLAEAEGTAFDRLFLASMIFHHEGAIVMVEELFRTPGAAQEEEIFTFASHVDADQRSEIRRMGRMLNALGGG